MKKIITVLVAISTLCLTSCTNRIVDIKSPCVGRSGSPCGPKKPINDWWLKNLQQHQDIS